MPLDIPHLVLSRRVQDMLKFAVNTHPDKEVQGFGRVERDVDGDIWVRDIIIPPQTVTGASVDLKPEVLTALMLELHKNNQVLSDWPLWWHSHANMGTGPSNVDENTLKSLAQEMDGYALGLVTNVSGGYTAWFAAVAESKFGNFVHTSKMEVLVELPPEDKKLKKQVRDMMKNVTVEKPVVVNVVHRGNGSMGSTHYSGHQHPGQTRWCWCKNPPVEGKDEAPSKERKWTDDNEREFYKGLQASYPPNSPASKMTLEEFANWQDALDDGDDATGTSIVEIEPGVYVPGAYAPLFQME